jgi:hypothetical protein
MKAESRALVQVSAKVRYNGVDSCSLPSAILVKFRIEISCWGRSAALLRAATPRFATSRHAFAEPRTSRHVATYCATQFHRRLHRGSRFCITHHCLLARIRPVCAGSDWVASCGRLSMTSSLLNTMTISHLIRGIVGPQTSLLYSCATVSLGRQHPERDDDVALPSRPHSCA